MNYVDTMHHDFKDDALKAAFRSYFGELGLHIADWEGLFAEMSAGEDLILVRKNKSGQVIGFIQFAVMEMSSWFFRAQCGFIREFWIREDHRQQGHGTALLQQAEEWLQTQGCMCALLTTDTASAFYVKHGYTLQKRMQAQNKDDVYMKLFS